ncbi:MAG TPA: phosphoglycerate mutase family protein [Candidatus Acidoferrum sp.]|nr:phosphoglycerate mutase family protein [Candidatus Acidoferrum sp.]
MKIFWKIGNICALAFVTLLPRAQAQEARTIYLVRHADKVSEDTDAPPSEAGLARAKCLAKTLEDARIQQIFTSDLQRTRQTAAPLAEKLHLKPVAIPIGKPDDLIEAIRSSKAKSVLVVWHDATLPKILSALGGPETISIAHTEYDRFFILTLDGGGKNSKPGFASLRYCDCPQ